MARHRRASRTLVPFEKAKGISLHQFPPMMSNLTTNREEIEAFMDEAKARALASRQVGTTQWRVGEYDVHLIWIISQRMRSETGMQLSPEQIVNYVEEALKAYHFIPRLQNSILTNLLDLRRYRHDDDPPHFAAGWALRHSLDAAIDAIEGPESCPMPNMGPIRAERYLSHRYRQRLRHYQIAKESGWSERNLERLRRELLERVAAFLFAPN